MNQVFGLPFCAICAWFLLQGQWPPGRACQNQGSVVLSFLLEDGVNWAEWLFPLAEAQLSGKGSSLGKMLNSDPPAGTHFPRYYQCKLIQSRQDRLCPALTNAWLSLGFPPNEPNKCWAGLEVAKKCCSRCKKPYDRNFLKGRVNECASFP